METKPCVPEKAFSQLCARLVESDVETNSTDISTGTAFEKYAEGGEPDVEVELPDTPGY